MVLEFVFWAVSMLSSDFPYLFDYGIVYTLYLLKEGNSLCCLRGNISSNNYASRHCLHETLTHGQDMEKASLFMAFSSTGFKKQMSLEQGTEVWGAANRQIIKAFVMRLQAGPGRGSALPAGLHRWKFLINYHGFLKEISRQEKGKGRVILWQL